MVAMERSSQVDSNMSYQIWFQINFKKFAKFDSVCFNIKKKAINPIRPGEGGGWGGWGGGGQKVPALTLSVNKFFGT